jgi:hypothetical protein
MSGHKRVGKILVTVDLMHDLLRLPHDVRVVGLWGSDGRTLEVTVVSDRLPLCLDNRIDATLITPRYRRVDGLALDRIDGLEDNKP